MRLKSVIAIVSFLILPTAYALPMPVGVVGRVKINNQYQNGITVTIKNLNLGETKIVTTENINGEDGWYVCALSANNRDVIQISYGGYTNSTRADLSKTTQWLNLTAEAGGGSSPFSPPLSPPTPSPPTPLLKADFTFSPLNPKVGDRVTFTDTSIGNVIYRTWNVEDKTFTTQTLTYTFTKSGYYTVSLVVMDESGNIDICQKVLLVKPSNETSGQNETNNITPPPKTNITLFILVKDKNNRTLPNTKVEIYQNNTIVQIVYTNESGVAQITLPAGSYRIKAYYSSQIETKDMQFTNDGRIVFLFNPEEQKSAPESFNIFYVIIPFIIIISVVMIMIYRRRKKKWW